MVCLSKGQWWAMVTTISDDLMAMVVEIMVQKQWCRG